MYYTIEGFESLTKQQMFDMAAKHVIASGPSTSMDVFNKGAQP